MAALSSSSSSSSSSSCFIASRFRPPPAPRHLNTLLFGSELGSDSEIADFTHPLSSATLPSHQTADLLAAFFLPAASRQFCLSVSGFQHLAVKKRTSTKKKDVCSICYMVKKPRERVVIITDSELLLNMIIFHLMTNRLDCKRLPSTLRPTGHTFAHMGCNLCSGYLEQFCSNNGTAVEKVASAQCSQCSQFTVKYQRAKTQINIEIKQY